MSERLADRTTEQRTIDLGDIAPAGSRHSGRRSTVTLTDDAIITGTANGVVLAHDRASLDERWRVERTEGRRDENGGGRENTDGETTIVSVEPFAGGVAIGERSPAGEIRAHDTATGEIRWCYRTVEDVGTPQSGTRFFLPFVVSLASEGGRLYAAARRYERSGSNSSDDGSEGGSTRSFESSVYAFESDGAVAWTYGTDASPIALDARGERVAVAFNRCPGDHQQGLVVLDAETGEEVTSWDPSTRTAAAGDRRIGDVSLLENGLVCTSHADYRAYRLDRDCEPTWRTDLATERTIGEETLYAYPNHCHTNGDGAVFLTGNTYPVEGRETESRHPDEHTAFGYSLDGDRRWSERVGGFVTDLGTDSNRLAVPRAQNFRTRDPTTHGLDVFAIEGGRRDECSTEGILTAAALANGTVAAIEEPVTYHDEGTRRGSYRLHVGPI
ncbi:transcriptional regulator [Halobacteriales archaeon QH_8_64_26]|nr:MAG: transcriptional regulator [Halobacteriales archaeon QH_8_64_26]